MNFCEYIKYYEIQNGLKRKNDEWAESGPRLNAYWARRLTAVAGHHVLMAGLAHASPMITAQWPRAQRQAGAAGGVQPGDKVWGNW
jgi:hypothetical protein